MIMIRIFHIWVMLVVLKIDIMSFSRLGSLECIYIYIIGIPNIIMALVNTLVNINSEIERIPMS